jgi:hypothetical protein
MALVLAATAAAHATAPPGAVLGAEGELFLIEQGQYGELMNQPQAPGADHSALVLRVRRADRPDELYPLPASLGAEVESTAALLYEEASDTLFVAWESRTNYIHSQVLLAGFSGGTWGDPVRVSDARFSFKSDPQLAVTRDTFEGRDPAGEPVEVKRTVLHVVWVEDRADGTAVPYSPVLLVDGVFDRSETGPIYVLTDLITERQEDLLPVPLADLPLPPTVAAGSNDHSVILGFVHPASGRLITVDVAVLSGDVSSLAGIARAHIIESGSRYDSANPGDVSSLAGIARAHIIESGSRYDAAVLSYLADLVRVFVLEIAPEFDLSDEGDLQSFSDKARAHIIESGVRLDRRGLRAQSSQAPYRILDIGDAETSHQVSLAVIASRGLEGLEIGADPAVLLSPDGTDALIAWQHGDQLRYQESHGDGWSGVRALSLATIDFERALEIVEHRIRNR